MMAPPRAPDEINCNFWISFGRELERVTARQTFSEDLMNIIIMIITERDKKLFYEKNFFFKNLTLYDIIIFFISIIVQLYYILSIFY